MTDAGNFAEHKHPEFPISMFHIQPSNLNILVGAVLGRIWGDNHGFSNTALEASRWFRRQVPRRYSGSSSDVLACAGQNDI